MGAARAILALAAFLTGPAVLADELDIPEKFAGAVERANKVGWRIFSHDIAASMATDELFRRELLPNDNRVRGWLTDEPEPGTKDGVLVTFVGEVSGEFFALYRVFVPPGEGTVDFTNLHTPAPLTESQRARWAARTAASKELKSRKDLCGERYNTVVLPPGTDDSENIRVYFLAATTKRNLMIAGGHFLYEYSADGKSLKTQRAFTRSCLDLSLEKDPAKGEFKGIMFTHLLDPTPTEVHVFLGYNYGETIYLGTTESSMMWVIMGGAIVAAKDMKKGK
jgi:hypothetical protein